MNKKETEEQQNLQAAKEALNKAMGLAGKDVMVPEEKISEAEKKPKQ